MKHLPALSTGCVAESKHHDEKRVQYRCGTNALQCNHGLPPTEGVRLPYATPSVPVTPAESLASRLKVAAVSLATQHGRVIAWAQLNNGCYSAIGPVHHICFDGMELGLHLSLLTPLAINVVLLCGAVPTRPVIPFDNLATSLVRAMINGAKEDGAESAVSCLLHLSAGAISPEDGRPTYHMEEGAVLPPAIKPTICIAYRACDLNR
eukprot:CAMPEP_0172666038 /NCGR_PEP_ID=MMETSP1074-20121228/7582_1 /TAXON_ID=2916 /ORGANISM="Ceratium fusus, Strain PA161109" /LENGTH=206 /DNA_ID=CAMNT_0013482393 /DNA_START=1764 /DNA_END=2385 /DNA_ORIENTATION=-